MNRYIKEKIDIRYDSMTWAMLKVSACFKDEYKKEQSEIEIIESYIECMNIVCNKIVKEFRAGMSILKTYSLCIPYVFICRHTIELILKKSIENKTRKIEVGHSNLSLWKKCKKIYDDRNLNYYDELIDTINLLDDNGEKFRYIKDKDGNEFANKPLFLNVGLMKDDIISLKKKLL